MSCTTKRAAWLAAIVLATTGGLVGIDSVSTVQPAQAALVAVEESGGIEALDYYKSPAAGEALVTISADGKHIKKVYDLRKGVPSSILGHRPPGASKVYCTKVPLYQPSSCLERPGVSFDASGCDGGGNYGHTIVYTNTNDRPATVDTYGIFGGFEFGERGDIPVGGTYTLVWIFNAEDVEFVAGFIGRAQQLVFVSQNYAAAATSC